MANDVVFEPVATPGEIARVAAMADTIWHEYFVPIIGEAQVDYMLKKFQSVPAITRQIQSESMEYFSIVRQGEMVGYTAIRQDAQALFLSKLYIQKSCRGQGIARSTLAFLEKRCRREGLGRIWLTVNRHNAPTIAAYRALGFTVAREEAADIGGGFVMDDYIMEKPV